MFAIFRKELNLFFSSLIGYLVMAVFLIINGVFLWLLQEGSILGNGYATLDTLFSISPWVFMFLVPAITMRSISEELKTGTVEILTTKPVTEFQIVMAKFLAGVVLVLVALLPTLCYFYSVYVLASPVGNVDIGGTMGSYLGLLLIGACYVSIGVFASAFTDNQIVAFIFGLLLCFVFYALLDWVRELPALQGIDPFFAHVGIMPHYNSISRGVIDSRDVLYFIGFMLFFVFLTKTKLQSRKW